MTDHVPHLFDRRARVRAMARAQAMGGEAFLLDEAREGLAARLSAVKRTFATALSVDTDTARLAGLAAYSPDWDFATSDDKESLDLRAARYDLAVSLLSLHAINDLPGLLVQIRKALRPDGLFMAALLGGETLRELRDSLAAGEIETAGGVSPRVAPFADVRELGGLLQRAGFALPVADTERTTVRYGSFATLLADLRRHGEINVLTERSRKPITRAALAASLRHYSAHHGEPDGRLRATFDIVYLAGWAPHESQQKPLKPGTGRVRLADALRNDNPAIAPDGDEEDGRRR